EVYIHCMNSDKDYEWEKIKLIFSEILSFRFIENRKTSSTVINGALIKVDSEGILFDFFPLIYDAGLKENPDSDFIICCRELKYEKVE
ncbi:hypothetical protein, partial [Chitinophaga sp.]|uniref:hypothetical protein n=1 Tax=Chitinophaga sp. TaxID=1869181 RepID=UPI002F931A11